jgi:hypothetical protein
MSAEVRPLWECLCREVAAANDMPYQELVARMEAGQAALEIRVIIDFIHMSSKTQQP